MSENKVKSSVSRGSGWLEGPIIGGLVGVLLTLDNLVDAMLDDRINGVHAQSIHRFLATEFRAEVVRATALVFALSVIIGALTGLLVTLFDLGRERWLGLARRPIWRRRIEQCCLILIVLGFVYVYDVASRPALHQSALFERGGVRRVLQIFISDGIGKTGVATIAALLLLGYCGLPLWRHERRLEKARQFGVAVATVAVIGIGVANLQWLRPRVTVAHAATERRPNVLIIASDSLRPDHLDVNRSPNINELAKQSTRFDRVITPLARTFPAWVSILTGQYPHHHGIRHMFPRWETREKSFDTLATRFASAGYRTAVVGDFAADIFRRIDLGFQTVDSPTFTLRELVREHLFKNDPWLLAWLRGSLARSFVPTVVEISNATDPWAVTAEANKVLDNASDKPFFMTVFYSTTHFPYASPGPYHALFRAPGYNGPFRYAKADDLSLDAITKPSDVAQIRALYDGAVRATDDAIGQLLDGLTRRGLRENTLVVVTADHGEQLYENGRSQGHGDNLEGDEAVLVPLIIHEPQQNAARRESTTVSLVDLAPTLLELAGLPRLENADGRSLANAVRGNPIDSKAVYSETGLWFTEVIAEVPLSRRIAYPNLTMISEVDREHGDQIVIRKQYEAFAVAAKHRMLELGNFRLLYLPTRDGCRYELYDRSRDPGYRKDVAAAYPDVTASLKQTLQSLMDEDPFVERKGDSVWPR